MPLRPPRRKWQAGSRRRAPAPAHPPRCQARRRAAAAAGCAAPCAPGIAPASRCNAIAERGGCCRCCRSGKARCSWPDPDHRCSIAGSGVATRSSVRTTPSAMSSTISEIPLVVPVVEHVDGLAGEDVAREQEQRHVRPTPGAVYREESQAGHRQAEQRGVVVRHQLIGALGRRIERQRMHRGLVHRKRHPRVGAIDGTRRGEHQVLDAVVPAAFQHVERAGDVAVDVGLRRLERIAHAGLGAQMHHAVEALARRTASPCRPRRPGPASRSGIPARLPAARGAPASAPGRSTH